MIRMCSWGSVLPSSLASTGPLTVSTVLIVPLLRCLPLSTPGTAGARLSPRRPSVGAATALAVPEARQLADRLPRYADERTRTSTELPPHGPEPNQGRVDASRSVQYVQIAGFRGRVGRSGRCGCCHDVVTPGRESVASVVRSGVSHEQRLRGARHDAAG